MIYRSFQHDIDLLRIRTLLLRIIAVSIELTDIPNQHCCNGHKPLDHGKHNRTKILVNLLDQLKSLVLKLSQNPHTRLPKVKAFINCLLFYFSLVFQFLVLSVGFALNVINKILIIKTFTIISIQ